MTRAIAYRAMSASYPGLKDPRELLMSYVVQPKKKAGEEDEFSFYYNWLLTVGIG